MLFFDTETTGLVKEGVLDLNQQPQIIELAAAIWWRPAKEGISMDLRPRTFTRLINPGKPLPPEIVKITGITDDMLANALPFPAVLMDFIEFVRMDVHEPGLVAHNLAFDLDMLVFELRRIGWEHRFPYPSRHIDTCSADYAGERVSLKKWAERALGDKFKQQTHRALDDVLLLLECYKADCVSHV